MKKCILAAVITALILAGCKSSTSTEVVGDSTQVSVDSVKVVDSLKK